MIKWFLLKVNMLLVLVRGIKLFKKKVLSFSIYIENRILNINYNYLKYLYIYIFYIYII